MDEIEAEPGIDVLHLEDVLRALADPHRLNIAHVLADGNEHPCHEFSGPITKATLSHHFRTLRLAGLISTRVEGRQRFIRLRSDDLNRKFPGLLQLLQTSQPEKSRNSSYS